MVSDESRPDDTSERLVRIEEKLGQVLDGVTRVHTSAAETRRAIRALDQKLVRIQEAIYFMGIKVLHPSESEELRSILPDPPERIATIGR